MSRSSKRRSGFKAWPGTGLGWPLPAVVTCPPPWARRCPLPSLAAGGALDARSALASRAALQLPLTHGQPRPLLWLTPGGWVLLEAARLVQKGLWPVLRLYVPRDTFFG